MTTAFCCSLIGLMAGLIGSVLLAVSLGRFVKIVVAAVTGHEVSIATLAGRGNGYVFEGFDQHLQRAARWSSLLTLLGLILLVASFTLQAIGLVLSLP